MQCAVCGAMVPEGQTYCPVCDTPVQQFPQQPVQQQGMPMMQQPVQQPQAQGMPPQAPMQHLVQLAQPQAPQEQPVRMTVHMESDGGGRGPWLRVLNRAMLLATAFAMAGALAFTFVTLLLQLVPLGSFASAMQGSASGMLGGSDPGASGGADSDLSSAIGAMLQNLASSLKPGFFTMLTLAMGLGIGGTANCSLTVSFSDYLSSYMGSGGNESTSLNLTVGGGMGIAGMALFLGAAFGAYMGARSGALRHVKWAAALGGGYTAICTSLIFTLLMAAGAHNSSATVLVVTIDSHYTALTLTTLLKVWILAGVGAALGVSLGNRAPGAPSVFHSAWRWMHRQSGYVRTVVEALVLGSALFLVAGFIHSLLVCYAVCDFVSANGDGSNAAVQWLAGNPVKAWVGVIPLLPQAAAYLFFLCCFGVYKLHPLGQTSGTPDGNNLTANSDFHDVLTGAWLGSFPASSGAWFTWVVFVAFIALTLYLALRAGKRYRADVKSAAWSQVWKAPLAMTLVAALLQFGFMAMSLRVQIAGGEQFGSLLGDDYGSRIPTDTGVALAFMPWCFLLPGVWMLIVEALARVAGVSLAQRVHVADGGCIYPEAPGTPFAGLPCAHEPADLPQDFDARHVDESWYGPEPGDYPDGTSATAAPGFAAGAAPGMAAPADSAADFGPGYRQDQGYQQYQPDYQQQPYQPDYQPQAGYQDQTDYQASYLPPEYQQEYHPQGYQQDYQQDYQPQPGYQQDYPAQGEYLPQATVHPAAGADFASAGEAADAGGAEGATQQAATPQDDATVQESAYSQRYEQLPGHDDPAHYDATGDGGLQ